MFGPPALMPDAIADLVAGIGGPSAAAGMLCIPSAELARWLEAGDAPQIALRLLCYAGPDGRVAAQLDLENELRATAAERDALISEAQRRRALIDERRAALAAKVKGARGWERRTPASAR